MRGLAGRRVRAPALRHGSRAKPLRGGRLRPKIAGVIAEYNRRQLVRALSCGLGGVVCTVLALLFFRWVSAFVLSSFGIAAITGWRQWTAGGEWQSYHESALYHELDPVSGGTVIKAR